tara:strand:- start:393 stop:938 length:546 start_codon:yes stop_codon:yes gene_type:complete
MTLRPELVTPVYPMPPPGERGLCYTQSRTLFFALRKDPAERAHLRFVGFRQPFGYGAHFVVEDEHSVYDQAQAARAEGHTDLTRLTKSSYWGKYPDAPTPIVRFDNEKFQVLHDVVSTFHDRGQQPCCNKILAMMLLIDGMWKHESASETATQRFGRIAKKIFRANELLIVDARENDLHLD